MIQCTLGRWLAMTLLWVLTRRPRGPLQLRAVARAPGGMTGREGTHGRAVRLSCNRAAPF
jgi:hypothetical protein